MGKRLRFLGEKIWSFSMSEKLFEAASRVEEYWNDASNMPALKEWQSKRRDGEFVDSCHPLALLLTNFGGACELVLDIQLYFDGCQTPDELADIGALYEEAVQIALSLWPAGVERTRLGLQKVVPLKRPAPCALPVPAKKKKVTKRLGFRTTTKPRECKFF